jgi:hypothetical protein
MTMHSENINLRHQIFEVDEDHFESLSIKIFHHQYQHNNIYKQYVDLLKINPNTIQHIHQIPFLPISFFKTQKITTGLFEEITVFESSTTTGAIASKHYIKDLSLYELSFSKCFQQFFGEVSQYCILGLLPNYLERGKSSLVYMVDQLIKKSVHPQSGFFLYDHEKLAEIIASNEKNHQKTILIGVSYALLDFAEKHPMHLQHTIIMETGGMKGRRIEISKDRLHEILSAQFGSKNIHSEYGMTELLSQAYSMGDTIFNCPPWMKIMIRAEDNPLDVFLDIEQAKTGAINVIDLANLNSCCFIATDDYGKKNQDGTFQILGRIENSDIRGCGLMII